MHLDWIPGISAAVTVVAAVAAAVAAVAARRQAREARRQAKAAEDQVREARRSAEAAEEQVELMRRQQEAYLAERDEREAGRRDQEAAQARLVIIEVVNRSVDITNHSEQPVRRPRIESIGGQLMEDDPWGGLLPSARMELIGGARQQCVRWEDNPSREAGKYAEVLPPHQTHRVFLSYWQADGRDIDHPPYEVDLEDVTITFTDTCGLRWRRTGNGEPVRIDSQLAGRGTSG
ncbi:MAG: hypothetical protein M3Y48_04225 [Actinomycetota bacterium]|nr:hypothetical protein [Actinomycetota bacterium]